MLARERAGQVAGNEAVDDLHLADVAGGFEQVEHREFQDGVGKALAFLSATEIFEMKVAVLSVFGLAV